jgi:ABC-2 type transport system permease protein
MKKLLSLIKVSLNHDMDIIKVGSKKQSKASKVVLPLVLTIYIMVIFAFYSFGIISVLKDSHQEYFVLSLFGFATSLLAFIEGIYKSGPLLFNCKDDQLLLSLPIKRRTVLFLRIFKFYLFELLYNSLFLLPAIIVYAFVMKPTWTYYPVSLMAIILLPIVPVVLSCIIGSIVTYLSSKFKGKNIVQTIISMAFILGIFYVSFRAQTFIDDLASKVTSLDKIFKYYYPVSYYVSFVNNFNFVKFLLYILIHIVIFAITIFILGIVYFKINSNIKRVIIHHKSGKYKIKSQSKMVSFVKKELNRFFYTPVFVTNAGFGLVLYVIICIFACIKFDLLSNLIIGRIPVLTIDRIKDYIPLLMFGLLSFTIFMTSITSSMISLESKSFNLLKSLPIKSYNIVLYKVIASLVIMLPCLLIGDIIIFIRFKLNIIYILLIVIGTIAMSFVTELIGILNNLKYPKMDATNDTEIVKQSTSATISVFTGMGLMFLTIVLLSVLPAFNISNYLIMIILDIIFIIIASILWMVLVKTSAKKFNNIEV